MADRLLLDTCALIWIANGDPISEDALAAIQAAERSAAILVCPISAWEVATLAAKGRIRLTAAPETWFERATVSPSVRTTELSIPILIRSASLPGVPPTDPADRMIIATAREHDAAIVTRDHAILEYAADGWTRGVRC
jgi:PIN domain nuclease of toxin-antitoxin system